MRPEPAAREDHVTDLLFLAQRCPYPPTKGDKIATWAILRHLRRTHRVHLGCFIDDPDDWQHEALLREHCATVMLRPLGRRTGLARAALGLLTGEPLSIAYYRDPVMRDWVRGTIDGGVRRVFVYSGAMARFVPEHRGVVRGMDFADIDSDKWRQYARVSKWPMSWVYGREARTLLAWERRVAAAFDHTWFVSDAEVADFQRMAPECARRVGTLSNGVDGEYFSSEREYPDPYPDRGPRIVFTGAMDYRPNIDAVCWFAAEVLPLLRARHPDLQFVIVGSRPALDVQALAGDPAVLVTGRVDDIRPYVAHAAAVVAPLRMARGIQNKVLEGMAMGRTVICSPQALEGIDAQAGRDVLVAAQPEEFANACAAVIEGNVNLGSQARRCMLARYDWSARLAVLDDVFPVPVPSDARAPADPADRADLNV